MLVDTIAAGWAAGLLAESGWALVRAGYDLYGLWAGGLCLGWLAGLLADLRSICHIQCSHFCHFEYVLYIFV